MKDQETNMNTVVQRGRIPGWLRPGLLYIGVPLAAVVVSTGIVLADLPNSPSTIQPGTPISSKVVRENFEALDSGLVQVKGDLDNAKRFIGFSGVTTGKDCSKLQADGAYRIFSQIASEFSSPAQAFDAGTGVFTVPQDGYYRLSATGYAFASPAAPAGTAMTFAFMVNGAPPKPYGLVGGAQLSSANHSPLSAVTVVVQLKANDAVSLEVNCPVELTFGSSAYPFRFQGEYLGK